MSFWQCGCCPAIGFDQSAWPGVTECWSGLSPIINLASDPSRLSQCKLVFAGMNPVGTCGSTAVSFPSGSWPDVKAYIEGGGRFVLASEFGNGGSGTCITLLNYNAVHSFLAAIGSSMTSDGLLYDGGCPPIKTAGDGVANIGQAASFKMAAAAAVNGGTSVLTMPSNPAKTLMAVEQLGAGFLFFIPDTNGFAGSAAGCMFSNCTFIPRLLDYTDGQIL